MFATETVIEGNVKVSVPKLKAFVKEPWEYAPSKAPVFYNPAMELNRDLAVLALQAYQRMIQRELVACEPLAGCGIRGIRLAAEVEGVLKIFMNDISSEAAKLADFNVKFNKLAEKIFVANEDANLLLSRYAAPRRRFDCVDIDPFGSPVPYLDSALRALRNNGLIMLTATDMAPLCGVHPKSCLRKYGGKPLRTEYCHELSARLLIGCLASLAAKHDIGVNPIFTYSAYNYVRSTSTVNYGAKQADKSLQNMGYILHCFSCFHRDTQKGISAPVKRDCPECGSRLQIAGPLWLGPLWDQQFCINMKNEAEGRNFRLTTIILKLISQVLAEIEAPTTYYVVDKICDKFNLPVPSLSEVMAELIKAEYRAVATHFNKKAIRTNAQADQIREIISMLTRNHAR